MKQHILFLIGIILTSVALGQDTLFVRDQISGEGVPFAKITGSGLQAQLSDIDGAFVLKSDPSSIGIKAYGYRDTLVLLSSVVNKEIYLAPILQEIEEVVVKAGENPAHRIIQGAIDNRKKNDPLRNDAFRYESYSKFIFDANREKLDSSLAKLEDSTALKVFEFFNQQHIFMLESASKRTFIPPDKDKEEIIAYKISGLKNPLFSTFANEMQSFSFYDEEIAILGRKYVSPIASGGIRRYLFILEDTLITNQDTTFTIFYRPRKGTNFNGMSGYLYISTSGFAIEKVIARPSESIGFQAEIIQEYEKVNGTKWFPSKLSTEIKLPGTISVNGIDLVGKGSTYIKNVEIGPEDISKRGFNNISVITDPNAGDVGEDKWNELRQYKINEREERTYEMIDSLSQAENLEQKLDLLTSALSGKIPLGKYINLDIARLLNFNQYEGFRLGMGLETSERLLKNVVLGGYAAYGFRDKGFKYGGYSTWHISRKKGVSLKLRYQDDVTERGGVHFMNDGFNLSSPSLMRHFFIEQMDRQRLAEGVLGWNILANVRVSAIANYQRVATTNSYQFLMSEGTINSFDQAEVGGELVWNIREKVMLLGNQRISKGTEWPRIQLRVMSGISGIGDSQFDYVKSSFSIQQKINLLGLGSFSWNICADHLEGTAPLLYAFRGNGTGRQWNLSVSETFETMPASRFFNTSQVALYTRLNFQAFKTKAKWNEPQISLHHAIGYGEFLGKERHPSNFESMDKGYFEGGLLLNGLLISNFSGIGIGVFYNYGSYSSSDWKQNIYPKVTLGVQI